MAEYFPEVITSKIFCEDCPALEKIGSLTLGAAALIVQDGKNPVFAYDKQDFYRAILIGEISAEPIFSDDNYPLDNYISNQALRKGIEKRVLTCPGTIEQFLVRYGIRFAAPSCASELKQTDELATYLASAAAQGYSLGKALVEVNLTRRHHNPPPIRSVARVSQPRARDPRRAADWGTRESTRSVFQNR